MSDMKILDELEAFDSLLEYVSVCIDTGVVVWKKQRGRKCVIGKNVGSTHKSGYTRIKFDGKLYLRHRLVFYVARGYLPPIVDHKHGVEAGDGIDNLQEATNRQNAMKRKMMANNTSGFRGVFLRGNRFRAIIVIDGVQRSLGYFDTAKEASDVYEKTAKENFGDFYVGNYKIE